MFFSHSILGTPAAAETAATESPTSDIREKLLNNGSNTASETN